MPYRNTISLSDAEASLLTTLAARGEEVFTTEDAYEELGKGRPTRDLLDRLVEKGWLARIEKGKYLIVPLEAGPDRTWSEDAHVLAGHLVTPSMVAYWSALNDWNFTEQVPRITYVADDCEEGESETHGPRDEVPDRACEAREVLRRRRVLRGRFARPGDRS